VSFASGTKRRSSRAAFFVALVRRRNPGRNAVAGAPACEQQIGQMRAYSMIRKSGNRFSEKIMLKQRD
jgi:hypothetical protein